MIDMLNCKETSHLLSRSLDQRLRFRERMAVRLHLLICTACTRFKRQIDFLHRVARRYLPTAEGPNESQLSATARERIGRFLKQS